MTIGKVVSATEAVCMTNLINAKLQAWCLVPAFLQLSVTKKAQCDPCDQAQIASLLFVPDMTLLRPVSRTYLPRMVPDI